MSRMSDELRARASSDRAEAETTTPINNKEVLLASAKKLGELAAQGERTEIFSKGRSGGWAAPPFPQPQMRSRNSR